jgi:hypothetical protein
MHSKSAYRPGHSALPSEREFPQDAKSPPLGAFWPDVGRFRLLDPEPYRSDQWMRCEWVHLWSRRWLCAALARDADCMIDAEVQRGTASRGYAGLRPGELEQRIQHFAAEYDRAMARD